LPPSGFAWRSSDSIPINRGGPQAKATAVNGDPQDGSGDSAAEGVYDPGRMSECLAQLELDEELCRMARSDRCWESSQMRYNNCIKNVYIPPLEVGR